MNPVRPLSNTMLLLLLIALCGLCFWQWERESKLRQLASVQRDDLTRLQAKHDDIESRLKSADAEILRLTTSFSELRANSVSKEQHQIVVTGGEQMRAVINKQNDAIKEQNEVMTQLNASVQQANESIGKLVTERDALAKRLNEVTAQYNELIKKP